jgi:hypothetical protein
MFFWRQNEHILVFFYRLNVPEQRPIRPEQLVSGDSRRAAGWVDGAVFEP